jgi:hypothetical protein
LPRSEPTGSALSGIVHFWVFTPGFRRLVTALAAFLWIFAFAFGWAGDHGVEQADRPALWCAAGLALAILLAAVCQLAGATSTVLFAGQVVALSLFPAVLTFAALKVSSTAGRQSASAAFVVVLVMILCAGVCVEALWVRSDVEPYAGTTVRGLPLRNLAVFVPLACTTLPAVGLLMLVSFGSGNRRLDIVEPEFFLAMTASVLLGLNGLISLAGRSLVKLSTAESQFLAARQTSLALLRDSIVLPYLRQRISSDKPSYSTTLAVTRPEGLSQSFDPMYEIPTSAMERLRSIIAAMPGGSIGVAGPRGVGKSTVLGSFCARAKTDPGLRVLVSAPVEYAPREFLLHLYAQICREALARRQENIEPPDPINSVILRRSAVANYVLAGVIGAGALCIFALTAFGYHLNNAHILAVILLAAAIGLSAQTWSRTPGVRRRPGNVPTSLETVARDRLTEIEYQQSISAEWTGAIKVPAGLDSTFKRASGFVRHPKNLPEIVDSLRQFLGLIAAEDAGNATSTLIIGIDELDKIEDESRAQQFLNDIKSIFGVPGCHFLVSVSEDAMSSFERRGLPFRDVFDSAFDEIISIEYLTFEESSALLGRRTTEIPVPFKALSFCLSGGLPRDLIRATRAMVELAARCDRELATVARQLVARDLSGKAIAVAAAIRKIDAEPVTSGLIMWCDGAADYVTTARHFQDALGVLDRLDLRTPEGAEERDWAALRRLAREIAGYAYYCRTLVEFFSISGTASRWQEAAAATNHIGFDELARARRAMALNPLVGWALVDSFRADWSMDPTASPAHLAGVAKPTGRWRRR